MIDLLLLSLACASPPQVQDGDLVFHRSRSRQSQAIALATGSQLTHVGVVVHQDGESLVLEAVQPVKLTPYADFVNRGVPGTLELRRLRQAEEVLTPEARQQMLTLGETWLGTDYDSRFSWSDEQLYCSELVYKLFDRGAGVQLGTPRPMGEYPLGEPEVRRQAEERWGAELPLDELVISPADIAASERLYEP